MLIGRCLQAEIRLYNQSNFSDQSQETHTARSANQNFEFRVQNSRFLFCQIPIIPANIPILAILILEQHRKAI